jgi:hypothetical protein
LRERVRVRVGKAEKRIYSLLSVIGHMGFGEKCLSEFLDRVKLNG